MDSIRTAGLTKTFKTLTAVDSLDITVPSGSVFGFLGPNGAGKTTTVKMLMGFLKPDSGDVYIEGSKIAFGDTVHRRNIGFLPDVPSYYNYMTGSEFLRLCARFQKCDEKGIPGLLEATGLKSATGRKIASYSRGMKQRLGIAQALVNNPDILILDEPVSALDPVGRKDVLDMLVSLKGKKTVFFSTHILSDVERICDYATIIREGRLVLQGAMKDISGLGGPGKIIFSVDAGGDVLSAQLAEAGWLDDFEFDGLNYIVRPRDIHEAGIMIPALLSKSGFSLIHYEEKKAGLEDIFIKAVNS
jgi:ABC-2 type transport system ATP-binding protein